MIRRFFFLRKKWFYLAVFLMFGALTFFPAWTRWPLLISVGGFLWLHRRREVPWRDTLKSDGEIFLAPVDGEVVKIGFWTDSETGERFGELRIVVNLTDNWGLHLPSSSEMEFLKDFPGTRLARGMLARFDREKVSEYAHTDMLLRSKNGVGSRLRFLRCPNGRSPRIWMKSGDRGRGAACFGYYAFGGSLIVFVPQPCDILVVEGEKIEAGQTVLAVFKTPEPGASDGSR